MTVLSITFRLCIVAITLYRSIMVCDSITGIPGRPENLLVDIEEDFRPGFLGHAVLNVSWHQPEGIANIVDIVTLF